MSLRLFSVSLLSTFYVLGPLPVLSLTGLTDRWGGKLSMRGAIGMSVKRETLAGAARAFAEGLT